jgi:hypothetical protein
MGLKRKENPWQVQNLGTVRNNAYTMLRLYQGYMAVAMR